MSVIDNIITAIVVIVASVVIVYGAATMKHTADVIDRPVIVKKIDSDSIRWWNHFDSVKWCKHKKRTKTK